MSMDTFFFKQSDGRLLECVGRRVGRATTERADGLGSRRWHHIQLIRTEDGRYVLAVQYLTRCAWERFRAYANIGTREEIERDATAYMPGNDVMPVPLTEEDKICGPTLHDVRAELTERFADALPRVLRGLDDWDD